MPYRQAGAAIYIGHVSESAGQPLSGGNVADQVVRVGMTVRKPSSPATRGIEAFLEHLHGKGFTAAPRTFGRDGQGRHVVEYIPGETVSRPDLLSKDDLYRVGCLIRGLHNAAQSFVPPLSVQWKVAIRPDSESMICHNDLAPWNLVRDGDRWVFIDWDGSGPGSALWDLAYAAQSFIPLSYGGNPVEDAKRLRFMVDGYGLDGTQRRKLPQMIGDRTRAMYHLLEDSARSGTQPWARLYALDDGKYWEQAADYVNDHLTKWQLALAQNCDR